MLHTWACWQLPGAADGQAVPHIAVVLHGDADGDDTGAVLAGNGHLAAAAAVPSRDTRGRRVRPARLRPVAAGAADRRAAGRPASGLASGTERRPRSEEHTSELQSLRHLV